jgi:hypothetical protein
VGGDDDREPREYEPSQFVPDEFESIPEHASTETKWLYSFATVVQIVQAVVAAWGLTELNDPDAGIPDKVFAGVVMVGMTIFCWRAWHEAYYSGAQDHNEPWRR